MVVTTRRKAGRGFTREEWINHHQRIVERANRKTASQTKLTESWNNSLKKNIGKQQENKFTTGNMDAQEDNNRENHGRYTRDTKTKNTKEIKYIDWNIEEEKRNNSLVQGTYVEQNNDGENIQNLTSTSAQKTSENQ